jgi:hypothetical protein
VTVSDATFVPRCSSRATVVPVDDTTVLYDETDHSMLFLNSSAGALWARCDGTRTVGEIVDDLAAAHGVETATIHDETWRTVSMLADRGLLVDGRGASGLSPPWPSPCAPPGWRA